MEGVFLVCFFAGLFFTIISFVLSGVFGGHDADAHADVGDLDAGDVDVDVSHDFDLGHDFDHSLAEAGDGGHVEMGASDAFPGLGPWSPTVLCSFLTTFGGVGYLAHTPAALGVPLSLLAAILAGGGVAAGVFLGLNRIFASLQASSEVRVADLVGREAKIITPIPEGGVGEIQYTARGTRMSAPARTVDGKAVGRATRVKIVRIAGTTYLVKPV